MVTGWVIVLTLEQSDYAITENLFAQRKLFFGTLLCIPTVGLCNRLVSRMLDRRLDTFRAINKASRRLQQGSDHDPGQQDRLRQDS
jgi:hypothetical protein